MATIYKIHPALGVARVGNCPDEFFIGPERVGERPEPQGGFKDAQCRVKRQAARFHIFAHHDDGMVEEITDAEAAITWTVHLVNKKAANPGRGNSESAADLTIDPGARTLNGPDQQAFFDDGTIDFARVSAVGVPLGEIRSDDQSRLLVLGGFGKSASPTGAGIGDFWANQNWYDDVSDGPVTATIKIRATNAMPAVVGAWVIAAPPKFAPHSDSVVTLYDRVLQVMIDTGLLGAAVGTSYTQDVYPILQRARDTQWVKNVGANHAWPDPVTNDALRAVIFGRLTAPGAATFDTDMPDLSEDTPDGRLTPTQYAHMQRWKDDDYAQDWVAVPAPQADITPEGLDRAALEACVGGAFFPGIEAGGRSAGERPILNGANYLEAFRLNHAVVGPGDITYTMALPWQADFLSCDHNWWPVPRPTQVIPQGTASYQQWARGVTSWQSMIDQWHTLGFVVRQGAQHVEVERCDTLSITLLTPLLNFQDVPQGPIGMVREIALAISFEVISPGGAVTLEYAPGGAPVHPQLVAYNSTISVGPTAGNSVATARLWLIYRTGAVGDVLPQQTLTVRQTGTTRQWSISVIGNTIARKTAAAAFALDRSYSMLDNRGDGQSKHDSLQDAAKIFIDLMLPGDGVGIVRFNEDAQVLQSVLELGDGGLSDFNRRASIDIINGNGLDPQGATSIGDGIFEARGILNSTATPFDSKSLVVLTDGIENRARSIADVAAEINEQTYAIGFGPPQGISAAALQTVSGNNGGYLLITGAINTDNRFQLQKYFLQILAGISNAEIVLDPDGQLVAGQVQRVPFQLTQGDAGVDVILLSPYPKAVDFRLQTPSGLILEPWRAQAEPSMRYHLAGGMSYYRLVLPAELQSQRFDHAGTWHALLTIGRPRLEPQAGVHDGVDRSILLGQTARSVAPRLSQRRLAAMQGAGASADVQAAGMQAVRPSVSHGIAAQRTLPYSLLVHAYSSISLRASAEQSSFEPGARIDLLASLAQSGLPMARGSHVVAEIERPDGSRYELELIEGEDGRFSGQFNASAPGLFRIRVRARGRTASGETFTRERLFSAGVWRGGDRPIDPVRDPGGVGTTGGGGGAGGGTTTAPVDACALLECLLRREGVISLELEQTLRDAGVDLEALRKCLRKGCKP